MQQRAPLHTQYEQVDGHILIVVHDGNDHCWAYMYEEGDFETLNEVWTRQKAEKTVPVKVIESAAVAAFFDLCGQEQGEYLPYDTPAIA